MIDSLKIIAMFSLAFIIVSCGLDEKSYLEPVSPPHIVSISLPANMALNSTYRHTFSAALSGQIADIQVRCIFIASDGDTAGIFLLYDDANASSIDDGLSYTSETSGDVAAGDGIFTRKVDSGFTSVEDHFTAFIQIIDMEDHVLELSQSDIFVYENNPPQMTPPVLPDTLYSGFSPFDVEVTVSDPQGLSDIVQVQFSIPLMGVDYPMTDSNNDGVYSYSMNPVFAVGKYPGLYQFHFYALDSIGASSAVHTPIIYIENEPPVFSSPALIGEFITTYNSTPDSALSVPDPGDTVEVEVTVVISDEQTLLDIDNAYINYLRPTGVWTYGYPLADNGLPWNLDEYLAGNLTLGDDTAGDGIYTFTKLYTSTADPGLHTFYFHCVDKVQQEADSIAINLWLIP